VCKYEQTIFSTSCICLCNEEAADMDSETISCDTMVTLLLKITLTDKNSRVRYAIFNVCC